jgi:Cys-rich protein (TIGR01571 family)
MMMVAMYAPQPQYYPGQYQQPGQYQPQMVTMPLPPSAWSHTLLSCFDDTDEFCDVLMCPWCKNGWLFNRLETGRVEMNIFVCLGSLCIDAILFGSPLSEVVMGFILRRKILQRYNIVEEVWESMAIALFCFECAACQHAREMTIRGEYAGATICTKTQLPPAAVPMMIAPAPAPYLVQNPVQAQYQPQQFGGYSPQPQAGYMPQQQYPSQQQQPGMMPAPPPPQKTI